jgi:hypothetical protein
MTSIRIERPISFFNMLRSYGIYVDGKKIGTIDNGETKIFQIEPGEHTIYAKIDWCYSPHVKINIEENDIQFLQLSTFKYAGVSLLIFIAVLFFNLIITYFIKTDASIINVVYLAFLLFLIYHFTFGRKKYLRLKQRV